VARHIGATGARITLTGRNLHTWTSYEGVDPSCRSFSNQFTRTEQTNTPPLAEASMRHGDVRGGRHENHDTMELIGLMTLGVLASACNNLAGREGPERILATSLDNPANANWVVDGAVSDLECALPPVTSWRTDSLTDELDDAALSQRSSILTADVYRGGRGLRHRRMRGDRGDRAGFTARFTTDHALAQLDVWDRRRGRQPQAVDHDRGGHTRAFSYILLGEGQCTARGWWSELLRRRSSRSRRIGSPGRSRGSWNTRHNLLNMARIGRARAG